MPRGIRAGTAIIDGHKRQNSLAWLAAFVWRARGRSLLPSKSDRNEIAETIANFQFAPSFARFWEAKAAVSMRFGATPRRLRGGRMQPHAIPPAGDRILDFGRTTFCELSAKGEGLV